jgi:hypothetical protein
LQLQIHCDHRGNWSVHGLSQQATRNLPSLAASVDYARLQCGGAPATIELMTDGFYAVVHQEEGWPRQIVGPESAAPLPAANGLDTGGGPVARLRQWLVIAA